MELKKVSGHPGDQMTNINLLALSDNDIFFWLKKSLFRENNSLDRQFKAQHWGSCDSDELRQRWNCWNESGK